MGLKNDLVAKISAAAVRMAEYRNYFLRNRRFLQPLPLGRLKTGRQIRCFYQAESVFKTAPVNKLINNLVLN
jgi:hypothetical protein